MADLFQRLQESLADRYRIERELGSGGMAIVYLAQDLKHERHVAVKVLQPELAAVIGGDRFLREIRIAANLNHPHILPLHDSGQANGFLYYVMPYVEGESLRNRLDRETQLPIEEAIRITQQAASALEAAHGQGIIHRDIKPENILLQKGEVLVADFGIALAVRAAGGQRLTESGLSLGTPQYMSPEQASADRHIDARSDVYSLGSVLYEMLVGEPPFTGPNVQAIVAKLLSERAPGVRRARDTVSPAVEHTVMKALEKLPADRFATAQEFADTLTWASTPGVAFSGVVVADARDESWPGRVRRALPWSVAGLMALTAVVALWRPWRDVATASRPVGLFANTIAPADSLDVIGWGSAVELSPDGTKLVFAAHDGGVTRLFLRNLGELDASPIPGTENGSSPFFSPDGDWVGFFATSPRQTGLETTLKRVSLAGGAPQVLTETTYGGASWGTDDTIVFGSFGSGLFRIAASGGQAERLATPWYFDRENPEQELLWPQILPGGEWVLFTSFHLPENQHIEALSLRTGERREIIRPGTHARYVRTGHLVYAWGGDILAVPFDLQKLEPLGSATPVVEGVLTMANSAAHYTVSENGTLAYVPGDWALAQNRLVWVDTSGSFEPLPDVIPPGYYQGPRISPDGRRLIVFKYEARGNLWLHDFERGTWGQFTDDEADDYWASWAPDGDRVAFNSNRHGGPALRLHLKRVAAGSPTEPLADMDYVVPQTWTPDGRVLLFLKAGDPATGLDIWELPLDADRQPRPLLDSRFNEFHPALSRDGEWLVYVSNELGQNEVFVRPYPGPGDPTQVSVGGGHEPVWSADGRTLFYRVEQSFGFGSRVMAVSFQPGDPPAAGRPRFLFEGPYHGSLAWGRGYDLGPDGRFLMQRITPGPPKPAQFIVVLDWFEELKAKVPVGN